MPAEQPDKAIEALEDEIIESRSAQWDAEKYLAKRHEARVASLEKAEQKWGRRWAEFRADYDHLALMLGRWLVPVWLYFMIFSFARMIGSFF